MGTQQDQPPTRASCYGNRAAPATPVSVLAAGERNCAATGLAHVLANFTWLFHYKTRFKVVLLFLQTLFLVIVFVLHSNSFGFCTSINH